MSERVGGELLCLLCAYIWSHRTVRPLLASLSLTSDVIRAWTRAGLISERLEENVPLVGAFSAMGSGKKAKPGSGQEATQGRSTSLHVKPTPCRRVGSELRCVACIGWTNSELLLLLLLATRCPHLVSSRLVSASSTMYMDSLTTNTAADNESNTRRAHGTGIAISTFPYHSTHITTPDTSHHTSIPYHHPRASVVRTWPTITYSLLLPALCRPSVHRARRWLWALTCPACFLTETRSTSTVMPPLLRLSLSSTR